MEPQKPKTTPKDFFLHLGAIVTLYISVTSLLSLLFEIINRAFPDNLNFYTDPYSASMRLAIASLLIVFPIYILLSRLIRKDVEVNPEKRELGIRRWLTYFTLFLAGITVMIDLIVLVNTFLGGEITTRFILKALATLIVAVVVFGYYLYDVRKNWQTNQSGLKILMWASVVGVLATIICGFVVMGSPMTARKMRFDDERISALQNIQWQIINYYQSKTALPPTLDALKDPISNYVPPIDPETKASYSYSSIGALSFKLCAVFDLDSKVAVGSMTKAVPAYGPNGEVQNENWAHGAGQTCFERTIDPKLYPPRVK